MIWRRGVFGRGTGAPEHFTQIGDGWGPYKP